MKFVILAQTAEQTVGGFDLGSYIERFGFPVVCVGVLGWALYKVAKMAWESLKSERDAWKSMYETERDLRIQADKRSEVALDQGKTTNTLLEALKDGLNRAGRTT